MSKREDMIGWLKQHPREDITTSQAADELGWSRTEVQQALHGLVRHGMGGRLRRTGQSTWIYQPPETTEVTPQVDVATDIPVGFDSHVMVTGRFEGAFGHQYLLAVLRDGADTGLRLLATPISRIEFSPPPGAVYNPATNMAVDEWRG